jgi:hypothetical protein
MTQTTVINKINDLKYQGFKEAYLRQIEDVNYHNLTFEDRLYNLLDAQDIFLQNKRIVMNSRLSRIKLTTSQNSKFNAYSSISLHFSI